MAWSWLTEHASPADAARQRQYVDFAQRNGWGYVLMLFSMAVFWGLLITGLVLLFRVDGRQQTVTPEQVLAQRFVLTCIRVEVADPKGFARRAGCNTRYRKSLRASSSSTTRR